MKRYSATAERETEEETPSVFPQEMVDDFRSVLMLGSVQEEFVFGGHTFTMRTLKEGELLRVGQLVKPYKDTVVEMEARKVFTVAAAVDMVDGEEITDAKAYKEGYDEIAAKAEEVKSWYPVTVNAVFSHYIDMETGITEIVNAVKK